MKITLDFDVRQIAGGERDLHLVAETLIALVTGSSFFVPRERNGDTAVPTYIINDIELKDVRDS